MIVDAYADQMLRLAMSFLGNWQDAEDVCQEAFIQAYRNLHRYDPSQSFKHWLLTILYRRGLDLKRKRRRLGRLLRELKSNFRRPASSSTPTPLPRSSNIDLAGSKESLINPELLNGLSLKQKAILTLWAQEGYSSEEIASIIGCRPATARVHLYLARKKIKACWEGKNGRL